MKVKKRYKPVVLLILDGFGIPSDQTQSTWQDARLPFFREMEKFYPFTTLQASGLAVGLPWGEEGNSEVGHLTIGAGKIIYNYLPRISNAIADGSFFSNEAFSKAIEHVKNPPTGGRSSLHILGLYSSGTVHAYEEHLYALLELAKKNNLEKVYLHLFSDGKDAFSKEGASYFKKLEDLLSQKYPNIKIASIIGRKYSMDRDNYWERTNKAYNLFTKGEGSIFQKTSAYLEEQYKKEIFDEYIEGAFLDPAYGGTDSRIKDNDAVIFFNFREDSERQLTRAFLEENFDKFERKKLNNLVFVTMTEYDKTLPAIVAFKSAEVEYPLARVISEAGLSQFHIAETEKYAHVTYFLNGGKEIPFDKEERALIPSPRVVFYNETPRMSNDIIIEKILESLTKFDFIVANFANADMVGHTGDFDATVKALEAIDSCLSSIISKVLHLEGMVVVTADHGNAEEKLYKLTGNKKTKHSINPVPFYLIANDFKQKEKDKNEIDKQYKTVKGTLTDIAPTILELLNLKKPVQMTGKSLLGKIT